MPIVSAHVAMLGGYEGGPVTVALGATLGGRDPGQASR